MSEPFLGDIRMFGGNFAPRGNAFCEGQLLAVSQLSALFSLLGTTFGGDGRTTFGLPDLRGRVPVHQGSGPGLTNRRLGSRSGAENVTLTTAQLASHRHAVSASSDNASTRDPGGQVTAKADTNIYSGTAPTAAMASEMIGNSAGGGQSHTNMMPYLVISFIIATQGAFPSRN